MNPRGWVAGAIAVTCGVTGCVAPPPLTVPEEWGEEATPSPISEDVPQGALGLEHGEKAAIRIFNDGCEEFGTGSGFAIDEHRIVTNRHVITGLVELEATLFDGTELTVTDSYISTFGDLGVVTVEEELTVIASLGEEDPDVGDFVQVVGYPDGRAVTITEGEILAEEEDELDGEGHVFATTAEVEPGSSGSAAYDENGTVIGVVYAVDDEGTSYIVPITLLVDFLEKDELQKANRSSCDV